jgi:glycosyltransferase involved in cell wall biosynthesis
MDAEPIEDVFHCQDGAKTDVTVAISLFNYESYVGEALDSVLRQVLRPLGLIVVDDCSTDGSLAVAARWCTAHGEAFSTCRLVRHQQNSGLAAARNTGFDLAPTTYVFVLDADNILHPTCVSRCLEALEAASADFAYPLQEAFGAAVDLRNLGWWDPTRLAKGNYIDAMALIRKAAWRVVGGYSRMPVMGWEDYDLWCKFAEHGYDGVQVPQILARYRESPSSMLRSVTNNPATMDRLQTDMRTRHPWLAF